MRDLRSPGLRRRTPQVRAEALRVSAWASASLERDVGALDELRPPAGEPVAVQLLAAYLSLATLARTLEQAPAQAIARAHALLAPAALSPDHVPAAGAVAPTDAPEVASAGSDGDPRAAVGRPHDEESAARVAGVVHLLITPTQAPAVVVAALVHAELAAARPFGAVSAAVGRLLARAVLVSRGVDAAAVTAPELGHLQDEAGYRAALADYVDGGPPGVAGWVAHCAQALATGAQHTRQIVAGLD